MCMWGWGRHGGGGWVGLMKYKKLLVVVGMGDGDGIDGVEGREKG